MGTTAVSTPQTGFALSDVQERPKLTATGYIIGIGEPKTTQNGDGDYESIDLQWETSRGSRKIFPRMLFRPEMFGIDGRFSTKMYTENPDLGGVREGKKLTIGETWAFIYHTSIYPAVSVNKKTNARYPDKVTNLMAICGGTLEGSDGFIQLLRDAYEKVPSTRAAGDFGFAELTPAEIVALLKQYHAALPKTELACIIKQSKDAGGGLKDGYELADWRGPFTSDLHTKLEKQAERTEGKPNSQRLLIGYNV